MGNHKWGVSTMKIIIVFLVTLLLLSVSFDGWANDIAFLPTNSQQGKIIAFNVTTQKKVLDIDIGSYPTALAFHPYNKKLYVTQRELDNSSQLGTVGIVDMVSLFYEGEIINVGSNPTGIVINPEGIVMYVAHKIGIAAINIALGEVENQQTDITYNGAGLAMNSTGNFLFATGINGGKSGVSLLDAFNLTELDSMELDAGSQAIVVHPIEPLIYVANQAAGTVSVLSHEKRGSRQILSLKKTIRLNSGAGSYDLRLSQDRSKLYVTNSGLASTITDLEGANNGFITVVDLNSFEQYNKEFKEFEGGFAPGFHPRAVSIAPDDQIHVAVDIWDNGTGLYLYSFNEENFDLKVKRRILLDTLTTLQFGEFIYYNCDFCPKGEVTRVLPRGTRPAALTPIFLLMLLFLAIIMMSHRISMNRKD